MVSISYRLFLLVIFAVTTGCLSLLNIDDSVAAFSQTIDKTVTNKMMMAGPIMQSVCRSRHEALILCCRYYCQNHGRIVLSFIGNPLQRFNLDGAFMWRKNNCII